MEHGEDLEVRVTAVENELVVLRQDVLEVKVLAKGASEDAGDCKAALREQKVNLESMRATQLEHGAALKKLSRSYDRLDAKVDTRLAELDEKIIARFAELGVTQLEQANAIEAVSQQVGTLTTMVQKMSESLESLLAKILAEQLQQRKLMQETNEDVQGLRSTQLEQQADVEKLQRADMMQRAEIKDIRATQLKQYADQKAGFAEIRKLLKGDGGGAGVLVS